ncbi:MAG: translocation/assembly module TamB domain-containing protein, partial [Acidocella sp.]|nr:translocation/assembly module TamB domain-containing protein [Acidocella sp.]
MRLLLRILLGLFLILLLAITGLVVALNTSAGRRFAEAEINKLAAPRVQIAGLAGHFPADIKLARLSVADADGTWLTGTALELRWHPLELLRGDVAVEALTATTITATRSPVPGKSNSGGGIALPNLRLDLARLEIGTLNLAPALAGESVALHVAGSAHLHNLTHGSMTLDATTPDGAAQYHLTAGIDPQTTSLSLHISEPPNGLLGHFAGPTVQAPLRLDATLSGPRQRAALNFTASLGNAKLNGTGTLGLEPKKSFADVVFTVPALAPFGVLAGKTIVGSTQMHLSVAQRPDGSASLSLTGTAALRALPATLQKFIGDSNEFSVFTTLRGKSVILDKLQITGADFAVHMSGTIARDSISLTTSAQIPQISVLSPEISGSVQESGTISGTPQDFATSTRLTGNIMAPDIRSAPFTIALDVQHLPRAPVGTLTGSGALENFPLKLDANLTRMADGTANLKIGTALWRSLNAQADLQLAPGATLPTGTAKFAVARLDDVSPFLPIKLHGAASGDFAYPGGDAFNLNFTTQHLVVMPQYGAIDGKLSAQGKLEAVAVTAQLQSTALFSAPARLALAGTLNIPARAAHLTSLSAAWHGLNTTLQGPADIETKPSIAVRHLALGLGTGRITLNGTLYPRVAATAQVQNLPASLTQLFAPTLNASGTLSASANLTGTPTEPGGTLSLDARALHLATGPAAALPPANLSGSATLAGKTTTLALKLTAGPHLNLAAQGSVPLQTTGAMNLHLGGHADLRLLDPILAEQGNVVRGVEQVDLTLTGTPLAPLATGNLTLANGVVQNIGSGLNLTKISARLLASGRTLTLQSLTATAGKGSITGHGTLDLAQPDLPISLALNATNATPISSDLVTATLDAALTLQGAVRGQMALAGKINIDKAEINIPHALPPSVANLPILYAGEKPPPPPAPPPPISLALDIRAANPIFVRGDGLFAELGGHLRLGGTAAAPDP